MLFNAYKNNAAKDLESVSVGDITVSPLSDCLGRSTGKTIEFAGVKVAEETIAYRKVGDHATNMPSTMRFGNTVIVPCHSERSAGEAEESQFVRLDNLKYAYDSCGNITEVRENGSLAAKYTYDAKGYESQSIPTRLTRG